MVYTLLFGGWYGAAVHWFGEWCTSAGSGKQQCTSSSAPTTTSPPPWSHSCPLLPPCSIHLRCVIQATDVFHSAHCYSGSQLLLQLPLLQPWSHYCHSSLIFIHLGNPSHCFQGCGETQFSPQTCAKGQSNRIFSQRFYRHQHKAWVLKEDTWVGGYYPLGNQLTEDIPHDQPSYVIVSHITNK